MRQAGAHVAGEWAAGAGARGARGAGLAGRQARGLGAGGTALARGLATGCALGALDLFSTRFDSIFFLSQIFGHCS